MAKIEWDTTGKRFYETGVKQCVLYPQVSGKYPKGVAWNGITAINESPSGAEASPLYADDIKYLSLVSVEELGLSIEAYSSPEEFDQCDGTAEIAKGVVAGQQKRSPFGLCYRTSVGNDVDLDQHGYKLHIVYGAMASPSEKAYATINDSPEAMTLSWEVTTTPVAVKGFKPTALITVDSRKIKPDKLTALEVILYGSESAEARLPFPDEIMTLVGTEG